LVQGLYVLCGRRCPLAPRLYQQERVCAARGIPFRSKVDLMEEQIRAFAPVAGTLTHVLLDRWYGAKSLWKAARDRGFLITTGLKSKRAACARPGGGGGLALAAPLGVRRRAHGGRFYAGGLAAPG